MEKTHQDNSASKYGREYFHIACEPRLLAEIKAYNF